MVTKRVEGDREHTTDGEERCEMEGHVERETGLCLVRASRMREVYEEGERVKRKGYIQRE